MPEPRSSVGSAVKVASDLYTRAMDAAADNRPAPAVRLFKQGLRRLGTSGFADPEWLEIRTRTLITLSSSEAEVSAPAVALAHLDAAVDTLQRLPDAELRRSLDLLAELQRAVLLVRWGRPADSLALFDVLLPRVDAEVNDDKFVLTKNVLNRSYVQILMNRPEAALADLKWGLALAVEHGHRRLEAKLRLNLGEQAQLVGDVPAALNHFEEAAQLFTEVSPSSLPLVRMNQARALLSAGLGEEAARHMDEALPVLRSNGSGQDIAEAEVVRAAAALLEGDYRLARKFAAAARRRFVRRGNIRFAEIAALTALRADAMGALDEPKRRPPARLPVQLTELAERLSALGLRDEAAAACLLAVRVRVRRGEVEDAERLLALVPKPRPTMPIDHRMLLRLCRAEVALATGRRRVALAQARAGFTELGHVRDRIGGLDLVCGTAVHGQALGLLALGLVFDGARTQAGARRLFAWLERTRAQVYRYEPLPIIEDPVLAKHITEMRHVQRSIQQSRLAGKPVGALELRYNWLLGEVSRLGWYTSRWGRPRPVSAPDEVAAELGEKVLVSLVSDGVTLAAVVVRDGKFKQVKLGPLAEIVEATKQLHADLDALAPDQLPPPLVEVVTGSAHRRADTLNRLIVEPLLDFIGDRELVIVPIGPLYALPWGVLPGLRGKPLSIAPSATAWMSASVRPHSETVLLAGGPGVPGAIGEVRHLRSVYPNAVLIDGTRATSAAVLTALDGAGTAHLVAHGAHEPENALFSRLELVDGPLYAHETARLTEPPEQVVLASCELAMSHIRPGEEALGFAGTLLASGSRTVIGAVARVGDMAAAAAMADLHGLLATGTPTAVALAEAIAVDPLRRPFLCLGAG